MADYPLDLERVVLTPEISLKSTATDTPTATQGRPLDPGVRCRLP
jgi:hypothetical protein